MACCIATCCRCNTIGGVLHGCTNIEAITMNQPTISTSNYEDQCGCRTCCSYPNNVWAILPAQILTVIAFAFSTATLMDCNLVRVPNIPVTGIDAYTIERFFNGTIPYGTVAAPSRGIGVYSWESIDGSSCSYDYYESNDYDLQTYWEEFVGTDFKRLAISSGVAAALGLIAVLWICTLSCVASKRRHRTILIFLLTIILPVLQSLTFRVLGTEFCKEHDCTLGDSGYMTIAAIILHFIAGILLGVGTRDFPGNPYKQQKPIIAFTFQAFFGKRSDTTTLDNGSYENNHNTTRCNNNNNNHGTATTEIEMRNYNNGFADAVEIPVESAFIDRALIESDAVPSAPTPNFSVDSNTGILLTTTSSISQIEDNNPTTTITTPSDSISKV